MVEFERTKTVKYVRIIQIFCDSKAEQQTHANLKTGRGVEGIGRRFSIKYNRDTGNVISYTLDEGEILGGELNGFGRMVHCYG